MKIYIDILNESHIKNLFLNSDLNYKTEPIIQIYSNEGIFQIKNNKIFKAKIIDCPSEKIKQKSYFIYFDNSSLIFNELYHYIPYNHVKLDIIKKIYNISSSLQFVCEENKDNYEGYFTVDSNHFDKNFTLNEIDSFLQNNLNI